MRSIKQTRQFPVKDFTPWSDDHEKQLYSYESSENRINKLIQKESAFRNEKPRAKHITYEQNNIENKAKKTLLDIGGQQKEKMDKMGHLKQYLKNKSQERESVLPFANMNFKLPEIKRSKRIIQSKSARKHIQNNSTSALQNKYRIDNQQEQIYKKYGQHRRGSKIEKCISFGSGVKNHLNPSDISRKYETVDVNNIAINRQKTTVPEELKHLKLRGKKYDYDVKTKNNRNSTEQVNYLPSQPNMTPHYLIFGSNQEDTFKKVFQQIVHKLK